MSRKSLRHHDTCPAPEAQNFTEQLSAPDARTRARARARARAVRALCPCRMGWEAYEHSIAIVRRLCKDPDPQVRAAALHVIEDALEMENGGLPTNPRENTNEMLVARRRSRFAPQTDPDSFPTQDALRRERADQRTRKQEAGKVFRRPAANR